jgi:hypothetical protein
MWVARLYEGLPKMLKDYPDIKFIFLTLTIKNCEVTELRDTLNKMNKSWERLSKRKNFPGIGFIKSTEITRSNNNLAHPHFHCLIAVKNSYFSNNYLSQNTWTELWQKSLRIEYTPIVNVKRVRPKDKGDESLEGLINSLREVVKYSVKPDDLINSPPEWLGELTKQLHKTRAVSLGGIFKNYLREDEPENLITESQEQTETAKADLTFGFREKINKYVLVKDSMKDST